MNISSYCMNPFMWNVRKSKQSLVTESKSVIFRDALHWLQRDTQETLGVTEMLYILILMVVKQVYLLCKFINCMLKKKDGEKTYMLKVIRV